MVKNSTFIGLDGFHRDRNDDARISLDTATLFKTDSGKAVLKYLRSITIEQVNGAGVSDAELRHMEGQRYVVALIEQRINHANRKKEQ